MNYLRGAVSAISAPYQYYKDLNPSTLTGAIDVIVVRRPKNIHELPAEAPPRQLTDEETELVCSPFHVRFGKWQVLRPQDKKVDVFVNGQLVPFSMKIGEAGEAFFVFETDEDVPDSLITSPVLEATKPGQTNAQAQEPGRFGAAPSPPPKEPQGSSQEPEFFDLDASAENKPQSEQSTSPSSPTPKSSETGESSGKNLLSRTAQIGKALVGAAHEVQRNEADKLKDKTVMEVLKEEEEDKRGYVKNKTAATLNAAQSAAVNFPSMEDKGDEILPEGEMENPHEPDVRYTDSMVFDMEGYHAQSHGREASDATLKSSKPGGSSHSRSSSQDRTPGPSRTPSPAPSTPPQSAPVAFPTFRATSEPPPDHDEYPEPSTSRLANSASVTRTPSASVAPRPHLGTLPTIHTEDADEYTWDWGNFPQKTPVRTSFPHPLGHGHGHLSGTSMDLTPRKGKGRMMSEDPDAGQLARTRALATIEASVENDGAYGLGGRLTVDKKDPTRFRVFIEGRTVEFELALVPPAETKRRPSGPLGGEDEVEDDKRFEQSKVDFDRFLNDAWIVSDPNLVLRWAGDKYIRREDGSPLMDALVTWRESALRDKQSSHLSSRPTSPQPLSEDEAIKSEGDEPSSEDRRPKRSATAIGNETAADSATGRAPTSSSWVRWWSRSRRTEATRPDLSHTNSEPSTAALQTAEAPEATVSMRRTSTSASAPPFPTTPESSPSTASTPTQGTPEPHKRFAKTLRLTSNQLKSLNLKSGANSVTFSLSSTGVAACSARLFVWDWTDLVVVSDIDGTITKSDALGHVFTMIGRDWTHMGVAKLYTDICRNGYKIMYLTSRAIGQADSTREYLKGIKQNEYQLPEGPVIMSPDRLMASLHREVIMRKPEVFKMACLRDIQKLFGGPTHNPFYAGFGNRITDALSYRSVNIPSSRIFTIDSSGEVKMELLELAGYKSSYIHMTDLVDQMFPPINRKWASEYTDFNYWKTPIQEFPLPDLSPPSPALSARSETSSTFSRLRNFSLVSSRQPTKQQFSLPPPATEPGQTSGNGKSANDPANEHRLRQMTSFERLSNTLASLTQSSSSTVGSPRSSTPTLHDDESESEFEEDEGDVEGQKVRRKRQRRRSVASMPGSLPGSEPGSDDEMVFGQDDDEDDHGYEGENENENEEEVPDEALDEALFAAGEMKNVDYI
ncbi:LNS2-domain-containing protein [Trametes sanguinea]|nr:LNS2-domain-containing protein [Trametes sanguinea]